MLAVIRTHSQGHSSYLCDLDLMRFSEEQVRNRMLEKGISDDAFFVCGITDWEVERTMTLKEVYLLKRCVQELYDGDPFVVVYLLKQGHSIAYVVSRYYCYFGTDEVALMAHLLSHSDISSVVSFFYKTTNWVNAVNQYMLAGHVLNTSQGFYIQSDLV